MAELGGGLGGYSLARPALPAVAGQSYGSDGTATVALDQVLSYAEYADGLTPALSNGVASHLVAVSVPASPRSVTIEYQVSLQITTAGNGILGADLFEITSDGFTTTATLVDASSLSGGFLIGASSKNLASPAKRWTLGPTVSERVFSLAAIFFQDGGSALAVSSRTVLPPAVIRHFIKVTAES